MFDGNMVLDDEPGRQDSETWEMSIYCETVIRVDQLTQENSVHGKWDSSAFPLAGVDAE